MNFYDVLSIVKWRAESDDDVYWVTTVYARDERAAKLKAPRELTRWFNRQGVKVRSMQTLYVGPCGAYDHLAGRIVGSFIEVSLNDVQ